MKTNEVLQDEALKQFVVIKLGVEKYGINIQYVQNILRMINITRVPKSPEYMKGVVNLRGEIIPVMSLRLKFNFEEIEFDNSTRIIFLELDDNQIGLIVDEVEEVIQLKNENIDKISREINSDKSAFVSGVGKIDESLVTLLNISELISVTSVTQK